MLGSKKRRRDDLGQSTRQQYADQIAERNLDTLKAIGKRLDVLGENGREVGEHEALNQMHEAKRAHERAQAAAREAVRLEVDTQEVFDRAKREMRRIAERA